MTALTLITRAMKAANIIAMNETPGGVETSSAKDIFNMMLDQWSIENLMPYCTVNEIFNLVAGTGDYVIGPTAATFATTTPVDILSAFIRDGSIDYPLTIVSNDEFQRISDKTEQSYPKYLRYLKNTYNTETYVPWGTISLWPVPQSSSLDIGLSQKKVFTTASDLSTRIDFPVGYDSAIVYNLAVALCVNFGKSVTPELYELARQSKANIKSMNIEDEIMINDFPKSAYSKINTFDINIGE